MAAECRLPFFCKHISKVALLWNAEGKRGREKCPESPIKKE
ncbi:hypothetical protein CSCA_3744 [Clostridium scatologenes]|uniref:Uncharacterized protein n=1 Tax=Clostridium scatologenes TaxID=1548 RepID=A0A0E3M7X0_CLOSL|nr:hypothetical protein CSCA_3744 [Clostridium scatologenes]